ncbi:MAG: hypothetical protein GY835_21725 [bacterium]|nr:hypothetical protein [bacterium]
MSKTFKALQRAARNSGDKGVPQKTPAPVAERTPTDEPSPETPAPDSPAIESTPLPVTPPTEDLEGIFSQPFDPALEALLLENFCVEDNSCTVEGGAWLRGVPDADAARALLTRHSLIHCLRLDEQTWYWFWSSEHDARERSETTRLRCDSDAF